MQRTNACGQGTPQLIGTSAAGRTDVFRTQYANSHFDLRSIYHWEPALFLVIRDGVYCRRSFGEIGVSSSHTDDL